MLERVSPQGETEGLHPLTSTHLARLDQGFTVAEPGHGDYVQCGARRGCFRAPVARQRLHVCVLHEWVRVELCTGVTASLRSLSVRERRRWRHAGDQEGDRGRGVGRTVGGEVEG
jgi:hypothetical protein